MLQSFMNQNELIIERKAFRDRYLNVCETPQVILGFSELHFSLEDLGALFPEFAPVLLKQVHSTRSFFPVKFPRLFALTRSIGGNGKGTALSWIRRIKWR
ncbi:MAG: hypothetical protein ACM3SY_11730 [Candidatus Omnitrophota bacterium]